MLRPVSHFRPDLEEKELLQLLKRGDELAFSEIYDRYWQKLFSIAANKLNNLTEAEELVQDIFLDLWKRHENIDIHSTLSAYLAVAVKYKVLDILAKRAQQWKYRHYASHTLAQADHSTEQWLAFEELKERIERSVAKLPEKCRLVFELSRNKGLSQKEIALEMGIAEKTVEAHLGNALRKLRTSLGSLFAVLFFFLIH